MLTELVEIIKFGVQIITDRKNKISKWQEVYFLYCSLDDVIKRSNTAVNHYLPVPHDSHFLVNTTNFDSPIAKWVYFTNKDFEELDLAVKKFFVHYNNVAGVLEIYDPQLKSKLDFLFWYKYTWFEAFVTIYCSGKLDSNGKMMKRTWLKMADHINKDVRSKDISEYPDLIKNLKVEELLNISNDGDRVKLVELGRNNIQELKKLQSNLRDFIRCNCKIENLL